MLVPVPQAEFRSSPGGTVPEIIKLLKDSDWSVRQAAAKNLLQLSEQGKTVKLLNVTFLMTIIAEFRPLISPAIPEIVELLEHNDSMVRGTAANTLSQLSDQGKTAKLFGVALLMTIIAGPLIATAIPEFVDLLEDSNVIVRRAGKDALLQLSEQGKMVKLSDVALLMTIIAEFRPLIGSAILEIVELLKHNDSKVRGTAANTLSQLSEQGKTAKLFDVALLMTIIAEFRPLIATAIPEFVNLLKDSNVAVRWAGKDTLSQLSEQGKTPKLSDVPLLMMIIAEFQPSIASAIPAIVKLLKHNGAEVRQIAAYTLSQLSEQGKTVKSSDVALLMTIIAEFRSLIAAAIPEIIKLLKHTGWEVRQAGVDALSQLSEHGKTVSHLSDVALLMTIIAEFRPLIAPAIPEIVNLLEDRFVRETAATTLRRLSEQGKTVNLSNVALLMTIIAESRPLIASAILDIADLLKHSEGFVRQAGVDVLSQLLKHGKTVNLSRPALLMYTIAEFHPLIGTAISEILDSFNAKRYLQPGMYAGPIFSKKGSDDRSQTTLLIMTL